MPNLQPQKNPNYQKRIYFSNKKKNKILHPAAARWGGGAGF